MVGRKPERHCRLRRCPNVIPTTYPQRPEQRHTYNLSTTYPQRTENQSHNVSTTCLKSTYNGSTTDCIQKVLRRCPNGIPTIYPQRPKQRHTYDLSTTYPQRTDNQSHNVSTCLISTHNRSTTDCIQKVSTTYPERIQNVSKTYPKRIHNASITHCLRSHIDPVVEGRHRKGVVIVVQAVGISQVGVVDVSWRRVSLLSQRSTRTASIWHCFLAHISRCKCMCSDICMLFSAGHEYFSRFRLRATQETRPYTRAHAWTRWAHALGVQRRASWLLFKGLRSARPSQLG